MHPEAIIAMAKLLVALTAVLAAVAAFPQPKSIDLFGSWRVVGGQNAAEGQFPYMADVRFYNRHSCGGSIINSLWILTAAHCLEDADKTIMTVVVGTNKLNQAGQSYKVSDYFIHEDWNRPKILNDIGLIKLSSPIQFSDRVASISLATQDVGENEKAVLSGWGRTSYPGSSPNDLQFLDLLTLSNSNCQSRLPGFTIYDSQVCTLTKEGQGACYGDSGGPLVVGQEQIGIVSWGLPCATGSPDVFTRVSSYADWLEKTMRK